VLQGDQECKALRQRLNEFTWEARNNEEIMRRFLDRELTLLAIETLGELLSALTEGLKESFRLQAVSLLLLDPDFRLRHLLAQSGLDPQMFPGVLFVDSTDQLDPFVAALRRPRLGVYKSHSHDMFFAGHQGLKSVAFLPMIRRRLVGSINLASTDPERYTRHHANDFLHRMAVVSAFCLENVANREQLVISGHTDPLTGLRNRRYLEMRLHEEVAAALRYRQPLSGLFIDADHFKHINDRYGHGTGDRVLRAIGSCFVTQLRASDISVRYGGEEFFVLLPRTGEVEGELLAERIRHAIAQLRIPSDDHEEIGVTVSIGIHTPKLRDRLHEPEPLCRELLEGSDLALYEAKKAGRNCVKRWSPDGDVTSMPTLRSVSRCTR
jgi:diguanylate cyclase (GGDEF)-like protein